MARTKLFLAYNQSNGLMRGAAPNADIHPSLTGAMPLVKIFTGSSFATYEVGVNNQYPTNTAFHSAAPSLFYQEALRLGTTFYVAGYGIGDTGYADNGIVAPSAGWENTWFPSKAGALTDRLISTENAALANLWNAGHREFDIIIYPNVAEADTSTTEEAEAYATNLANFHTKHRANLAGTGLSTATIKYFFTKLGTDTSYDSTNLATVNAAMQAFVNARNSEVPNSALIDNPTGDGLQGDLHHRTAAGYRSQGIRQSAMMASAGW